MVSISGMLGVGSTRRRSWSSGCCRRRRGRTRWGAHVLQRVLVDLHPAEGVVRIGQRRPLDHVSSAPRRADVQKVVAQRHGLAVPVLRPVEDCLTGLATHLDQLVPGQHLDAVVGSHLGEHLGVGLDSADPRRASGVDDRESDRARRCPPRLGARGQRGSCCSRPASSAQRSSPRARSPVAVEARAQHEVVVPEPAALRSVVTICDAGSNSAAQSCGQRTPCGMTSAAGRTLSSSDARPPPTSVHSGW